MLTTEEIKKFQTDITYSHEFSLKANYAKCLSDVTCLKIVYMLVQEKYICPSDFAEILQLSLPAISHQLARLKQMNLVSTVRHGQKICYFLTDSYESKLMKRLVNTIIA